MKFGVKIFCLVSLSFQNGFPVFLCQILSQKILFIDNTRVDYYYNSIEIDGIDNTIENPTIDFDRILI